MTREYLLLCSETAYGVFLFYLGLAALLEWLAHRDNTKAYDLGTSELHYRALRRSAYRKSCLSRLLVCIAVAAWLFSKGVSLWVG